MLRSLVLSSLLAGLLVIGGVMVWWILRSEEEPPSPSPGKPPPARGLREPFAQDRPPIRVEDPAAPVVAERNRIATESPAAPPSELRPYLHWNLGNAALYKGDAKPHYLIRVSELLRDPGVNPDKKDLSSDQMQEIAARLAKYQEMIAELEKQEWREKGGAPACCDRPR